MIQPANLLQPNPAWEARLGLVEWTAAPCLEPYYFCSILEERN